MCVANLVVVSYILSFREPHGQYNPCFMEGILSIYAPDSFTDGVYVSGVSVIVSILFAGIGIGFGLFQFCTNNHIAIICELSGQKSNTYLGHVL